MSKVNSKDTRTKPIDVVVVSFSVNQAANFFTEIEINYKQKKNYCLLCTDLTMCASVFIVDFEDVSADWESKEGIDYKK